jgi:hypothetical protein
MDWEEPYLYDWHGMGNESEHDTFSFLFCPITLSDGQAISAYVFHHEKDDFRDARKSSNITYGKLV